jgi:hypothetical protein
MKRTGHHASHSRLRSHAVTLTMPDVIKFGRFVAVGLFNTGFFFLVANAGSP